MLTICKACNITQNGMINIYNHPNKLDVMFINITGIAEVLLTDALCITCYDELKVAHNFKQKCLQTEIVRRSFRKVCCPNPTSAITRITESIYTKYNTHDQQQSVDEIEIIQLLSDHQTETDDDDQINEEQHQENNNNMKCPASDKIKDDINLQTTIQNQVDNSEFDDNEREQIKNIVVNNNNHNNDIEESPSVQHKIDNVKIDCEHNDNDIIVIDIDEKEDEGIINNNYKNIERDLNCTKCKKTFITNISYKRHLKDMHSIDIRKSSKVGRNKQRRGPSPNLLENGENIFATLKDTQCEYCFANFATKEKMFGHTKMHINEEKPYRCYRENCSSQFKNRIGLRKHIETHSSVKRYKCKYCDHRFHQLCNAKSHERYHTGEKPFLCPHCDKAFAESGNLKSHIRFHTGERPYACPHCPKTFTTHYAHKIHIRSHTQERPYKCSICDKSFNSSGKLVVHKRIHSGIRPYKCGVCVATFIDSTGLKRHMKIH